MIVSRERVPRVQCGECGKECRGQTHLCKGCSCALTRRPSNLYTLVMNRKFNVEQHLEAPILPCRPRPWETSWPLARPSFVRKPSLCCPGRIIRRMFLMDIMFVTLWSRFAENYDFKANKRRRVQLPMPTPLVKPSAEQLESWTLVQDKPKNRRAPIIRAMAQKKMCKRGCGKLSHAGNCRPKKR